MCVRALLVFALASLWTCLAVASELPTLGLNGETVTPDLVKTRGLAAPLGVLVLEVAQSGAAAKAGLKAGDIIVAIDGSPVSGLEDLVAALKRFGPGKRVEVTRIRGSADEATVIVELSTVADTEAPVTRSVEGTDEGPRTRGPAAESPYTIVKVYYATDRNRTGLTDAAFMYGPDRSEGELALGSCEVSLPQDHRLGELEAPSVTRLEFKEDPAKHVVLLSVKEQPEADFYKDVGRSIAMSGSSKSALIFVHGYNVNFKDAARRTAQMTYDLQFPGAAVFFSWPSQGNFLSYTVDEANIEYARADLKKFIKDFALRSTAEQIYLIAHSMGNRGLAGALVDLFRESPEVKAKIKEVILAAPDIDADVFKRDIAPAITAVGENVVTLYASSSDWALRASKRFHGYARAGDSGQKMTIVPSMVTIDASDVETGFLGHSYFAESNSIIGDLFAIFSGRRKPEERKHLVSVESPAGRYWRMSKAAK
jgi:esterase/lipase superfamily enzyme